MDGCSDGGMHKGDHGLASLRRLNGLLVEQQKIHVVHDDKRDIHSLP
jgi:hypothetical protein